VIDDAEPTRPVMGYDVMPDSFDSRSSQVARSSQLNQMISPGSDQMAKTTYSHQLPPRSPNKYSYPRGQIDPRMMGSQSRQVQGLATESFPEEEYYDEEAP